MKLYDGARLTWDGWHQVAAVRDAVAQVVKQNPPAEVATAAAHLDSLLARVQGDPTPLGNYAVWSGPPNFASLNGIEPGESVPLLSMTGQLRTTDYGDMAPSSQMQKAWAMACGDLRTVVAAWQGLKSKELAEFNTLLSQHNLTPITPPGALVAPECGPVGAGAQAVHD
jgi:hypothetical protein